ncbi:MAG: bifunctional hydroxymethylpyrimidine kinase/phosphomethylpyrimidine kinase [Vulcanimicrobiaceae bacterium]
MNARTVVSIGTAHPWNTAGIGLDIRLGIEFDVRVVTAIAAVSAQDATGLHALSAVDASVLQAELDAIPWESARAVRVGVLGSAANVETVARRLETYPAIPAVVDPVVEATIGSGALADAPTFAAVRDRLCVLPSAIPTPNLPEAARLLGRPRIGRDDMIEAARTLRARGSHAVLLKGGHLDGDVADVLSGPGGEDLFVDERLPGRMRGTGCVLAMALAAELARGLPLIHAVRSARSFVRSKIARQMTFGGINVAY